jgi:transcriptional regulator with XRE-family HTH domain
MDPNDQLPELARILRTRREELGLTRRDVARNAGVDRAGLTRAESGQKTPAPETLAGLARALGLPLSELYQAAGYPLPELPAVGPYLRRAYGFSEATAAEIELYLERIAALEGGATEPHGQPAAKSAACSRSCAPSCRAGC